MITSHARGEFEKTNEIIFIPLSGFFTNNWYVMSCIINDYLFALCAHSAQRDIMPYSLAKHEFKKMIRLGNNN